MLIVLNNETLTRNIEYGRKKGSNSGDIILNQNAKSPKINEYTISDFNSIPDRSTLHNHSSLISMKSSSVIHKVFVFDKFQINDVNVNINEKFIVFIRESGINPPKVRLICQGMNRRIDSENINNCKVLD